jgi:hypothetical protein
MSLSWSLLQYLILLCKLLSLVEGFSSWVNIILAAHFLPSTAKHWWWHSGRSILIFLRFPRARWLLLRGSAAQLCLLPVGSYGTKVKSSLLRNSWLVGRCWWASRVWMVAICILLNLHVLLTSSMDWSLITHFTEVFTIQKPCCCYWKCVSRNCSLWLAFSSGGIRLLVLGKCEIRLGLRLSMRWLRVALDSTDKFFVFFKTIWRLWARVSSPNSFDLNLLLTTVMGHIGGPSKSARIRSCCNCTWRFPYLLLTFECLSILKIWCRTRRSMSAGSIRIWIYPLVSCRAVILGGWISCRRSRPLNSVDFAIL